MSRLSRRLDQIVSGFTLAAGWVVILTLIPLMLFHVLGCQAQDVRSEALAEIAADLFFVLVMLSFGYNPRLEDPMPHSRAGRGTEAPPWLNVSPERPSDSVTLGLLSGGIGPALTSQKGGIWHVGPGPWMGPMWGFWWIFPVIGLLVCLFFVIAMVRMMRGGGRFMCMGPHNHDSEETARLRREVEELREEAKKQATR